MLNTYRVPGSRSSAKGCQDGPYKAESEGTDILMVTKLLAVVHGTCKRQGEVTAMRTFPRPMLFSGRIIRKAYFLSSGSRTSFCIKHSF